MASEKKRHEIKGELIRAKYGHSFPGKLSKVKMIPPAFLFHGTNKDVLDEIKRVGIKPMSRQYVHLSETIADAEKVALRKSNYIQVLKIDAFNAYNKGVAFYKEDQVWLSDFVPNSFIID